MTIKLYNTAQRKKVDFTPIDAQNVRMYVCGPTVYDRAHIGNARPAVVFDVRRPQRMVERRQAQPTAPCCGQAGPIC